LFIAEKQMENACERYVAAREQWLGNIGSEIVREQYSSARDHLFAAFAYDWTESHILLLNAFRQFRRALVRDGVA